MQRGVALDCSVNLTILTSSVGKTTMGVRIAVAQFERDLLIERTQAALQRVKSEGRKLGRPSALSDGQQTEVR